MVVTLPESAKAISASTRLDSVLWLEQPEKQTQKAIWKTNSTPAKSVHIVDEASSFLSCVNLYTWHFFEHLLRVMFFLSQ